MVCCVCLTCARVHAIASRSSLLVFGKRWRIQSSARMWAIIDQPHHRAVVVQYSMRVDAAPLVCYSATVQTKCTVPMQRGMDGKGLNDGHVSPQIIKRTVRFVPQFGFRTTRLHGQRRIECDISMKSATVNTLTVPRGMAASLHIASVNSAQCGKPTPSSMPHEVREFGKGSDDR